jgi:peptidoglycan/LPS O-acetylase OafA/YrhL
VAAGGSIRSERRLGVLDGLRGIAILLVLWYHVWEITWLPAPAPWLQFVPETGFIGVHLFFFLSGFVISYPFVRALLANAASPSWGHFAWRRFTKIVPSYLLSIAVAYAIGYAQIQPYAATVPDVLAHVLFVHTWFPTTYGTINGVLWTLAVEIEFYCTFPLVWWCFSRSPWLSTAAMIAVAWLWRAWMWHCCAAGLFDQWSENLPGYLDIFAFGMLAAYLFVRLRERASSRMVRSAALLLALAGAVWAVALLRMAWSARLEPHWPYSWQIDMRWLFGLAFAMLALGSLLAPRWWQHLLDNAPLRFMAAISYNLYLYHQMIAREFLMHRIPPYEGIAHADLSWQRDYTALAFGVTILQAAAITYCFERPLLRLPPPRLIRGPGWGPRLSWSTHPSEATRSPKPR